MVPVLLCPCFCPSVRWHRVVPCQQVRLHVILFHSNLVLCGWKCTLFPILCCYKQGSSGHSCTHIFAHVCASLHTSAVYSPQMCNCWAKDPCFQKQAQFPNSLCAGLSCTCFWPQPLTFHVRVYFRLSPGSGLRRMR